MGSDTDRGSVGVYDISCVYAAKNLANLLKMRPPSAPAWVKKSWHAVTRDEDVEFRQAGLEKNSERDTWLVMHAMGLRLGAVIGEYAKHDHSTKMGREKFEGLFIPDGLEAGLHSLWDKYLMDQNYKYSIVDPNFEYNVLEWLVHEVYSRRENGPFNLLDHVSVEIGARDDITVSRDVKDGFVVKGYLP